MITEPDPIKPRPWLLCGGGLRPASATSDHHPGLPNIFAGTAIHATRKKARWLPGSIVHDGVPVARPLATPREASHGSPEVTATKAKLQ